MTNLTANEAAVLAALLNNHFGDSEVWAECINDSGKPSGITGKALSGVCASLAKKGLIKSSGTGRDAVVSITKAGREAGA